MEKKYDFHTFRINIIMNETDACGSRWISRSYVSRIIFYGSFAEIYVFCLCVDLRAHIFLV